MTRTDYLEPQNGDFIAYIDMMQQESIDALKIANADRIAHADQAGSSSLKDIASEFIKRRDDVTNNAPATIQIPVEESRPQQQPAIPIQNISKRPSVAEEFKNVPKNANKRHQASPLFGLGNFFLIVGIFVTIFSLNTEIKTLTAPGIFLTFFGIILMKATGRR